MSWHRHESSYLDPDFPLSVEQWPFLKLTRPDLLTSLGLKCPGWCLGLILRWFHFLRIYLSQQLELGYVRISTYLQATIPCCIASNFRTWTRDHLKLKVSYEYPTIWINFTEQNQSFDYYFILLVIEGWYSRSFCLSFVPELEAPSTSRTLTGFGQFPNTAYHSTLASFADHRLRCKSHLGNLKQVFLCHRLSSF